jgi:AraC-like DNA-binding protein
MIDHIADIPTRQEEEGRLVANWLRRFRDCLRDGPPHLFVRALERAGLSESDLTQTSKLTQVHLDVVGAFIRQDVPDLTLKMWKSADLLDLGVMGYAVISCETVREAINLLVRYQDLTSDRFVEAVEMKEAGLSISPVPMSSHVGQLQNIAEDCLGGNWRAIELLIGPDADVCGASAYFAFPEPAHSEAYRELFKLCELHFDAERTELIIPEKYLGLPVASANHVVLGVTAAICEQILGPGRGVRMDTPGAVRRLLLSRPGKRMLRLEEAAEELFMSTAQLRKRLYRQETSYKNIVLETRMGLARHYLESTPLSIQEIAFLLDYAQPGPFSRAFKKYYGFPPREIRVPITRDPSVH